MIPLALFGRSVKVQIGVENALGVEISALRIGFKVEHKAGTPGTATIRIFNPSPATLGLMRTPKASIRLLAGYDPAPKTAFWGQPIRGGVVLRTEGPDRILEVDAADGGLAYQAAFIQVGITTPSTFGQVLAIVLAQTQWTLGHIDDQVEGISLPHGIALQGRPAEVMNRLAAAVKPFGAAWYVSDNALNVVARGQPTPGVAPLISSTQGNLIGSPSYSSSGSPPVTGIKLRALLDATMRPYRPFALQSIGLSGSFVARDVTFQGDSGYSNEFYMDIDARPLGMP